MVSVAAEACRAYDWDMLAYVFWHWPAADADASRYVETLLTFHRTLASTPPPGLRGSRVYEVEGAPWVPVPRAYEDWYLVEDFTALGALNEAAVSGARRGPHDAAARLADGGRGAVYGLLGQARGRAPQRTIWCSKPRGVSYDDFLPRLPPGEVWRRQMVLGPAPEFCIVGTDAAEGLEGFVLETRPIFTSG